MSDAGAYIHIIFSYIYIYVFIVGCSDYVVQIAFTPTNSFAMALLEVFVKVRASGESTSVNHLRHQKQYVNRVRKLSQLD